MDTLWLSSFGELKTLQYVAFEKNVVEWGWKDCSFPIGLEISLNETWSFERNVWHCSIIAVASSWGNDRVIFCESIIIPRNSIFWQDWRTDFSILISPRLAIEKPKYPLQLTFSSWVPAIKRILSNYRIIFSLRQMDIGTFMSFVKTLGAEERPKHRQRNW